MASGTITRSITRTTGYTTPRCCRNRSSMQDVSRMGKMEGNRVTVVFFRGRRVPLLPKLDVEVANTMMTTMMMMIVGKGSYVVIVEHTKIHSMMWLVVTKMMMGTMVWLVQGAYSQQRRERWMNGVGRGVWEMNRVQHGNFTSCSSRSISSANRSVTHATQAKTILRRPYHFRCAGRTGVHGNDDVSVFGVGAADPDRSNSLCSSEKFNDP